MKFVSHKLQCGSGTNGSAEWADADMARQGIRDRNGHPGPINPVSFEID
ncbi:hypothetical protein GCM10010924_50450 [Rhizobium wenxiniae]|nr:hypothetical protein GCM10010924_50450 [Rhizobium wenxiniae]